MCHTYLYVSVVNFTFRNTIVQLFNILSFYNFFYIYVVYIIGLKSKKNCMIVLFVRKIFFFIRKASVQN